jgi:hypothetical protein
VGWKEFFELPGGRVVHQFFKYPLEVGEWIGPVAADLMMTPAVRSVLVDLGHQPYNQNSDAR